MPRKPPLVVRCSLVLALTSAAAAFAGTSTAPNPVVTFSSPGTKQVSLQACNSGGCNTVVKSVSVLDPMPAVTSLLATPNPVVQGDTVHLTGVGNGAPPLTFNWRILDPGGTQVATFSGASADWTVNVAPGVYSVYLDLGNSHGVQTPQPAPVVVLITPFIFSDGFEQGNTNLWLSPPP
ncbi:MAG TPA: hypothetical protein VGS57_14590 [Thermoanaerobaculia bacterium]|nr:hypothetical protein [Thermoanaerobaculia bacterium]